jgi:hypothetical protein
MEQPTRYMKILVRVDNGEPTVTSVEVDSTGKETQVKGPELVDPSLVYGKEPRHIGTVLLADSSPGCVYWIGGRPVKVC